MGKFQITGMIKQNGAPNMGGSRILAFFNFHSPDIGMKGVALVIKQNGEWDVWPPKIEGATRSEAIAKGRCVFFIGDHFRKHLMPIARDLYWQLGGTEGRACPVANRDAGQPDDSGLQRWLDRAA